MNWNAISALAELVGAIGVILSLFYLGYQIRLNSDQVKQNSRFVESSVYQSVNEAQLGWIAHITQTPEVAQIWSKIRRGIELERAERPQAWGVVSMLFLTLEGHHKHFTNGIVSRAPLQQAGLGRLLKSPYVAEWLERSGEERLAPEFLAEINRLRNSGT